jgi:hypothetical protein
MKNSYRYVFILTLLSVMGLSSCSNLKPVNDYSTYSLTIIKKYENIQYGFKQNCLDDCLEKNVRELSLNFEECDCYPNDKADSITNLIYYAIRGYLDGLQKLSNNEDINYNIVNIFTSVGDEDFGSAIIDKELFLAHHQIASLLVAADIDRYKKREVFKYMNEGFESLQVLINFMDKSLSILIINELTQRKFKTDEYYLSLIKDPLLSKYEKSKVVADYYLRLNFLENKLKEFSIFSKGLRTILACHQILLEGNHDFNNIEFKKNLLQYSSEFQDIISEFNKLKK